MPMISEKINGKVCFLKVPVMGSRYSVSAFESVNLPFIFRGGKCFLKQKNKFNDQFLVVGSDRG